MRDLTKTITVTAAPLDAFRAILDVRGWWGHDVEGETDVVGAEFTFRGKDVHRSLIRITDLVPGELVAWEVLDNHLTYVSDQSEWVGTRISFEISPHGDGAQVRFTHHGLVPAFECFDVCSDAWSFFILTSLPALIETGVGQPLAVEAGRLV